MKFTCFSRSPLLFGHGAASPCFVLGACPVPDTATQRRDQIKKDRKSGAFTLVEVLAALLFLAIAVPAIVGALGIANRTSEVAERSSIAGGLAENKLNEMLVDNAWQSAAQSNGDFGTDFPFYHWQMTTQTWAGGNVTGTGNTVAATPTTNASNTGTGSTATSTLTELSIEVFYPVQGSEHSVRLTTVVNASATTTGTSSSTTK